MINGANVLSSSDRIVLRNGGNAGITWEANVNIPMG
jgi:hypothetical protein